jgi:hypothetical protein
LAKFATMVEMSAACRGYLHHLDFAECRRANHPVEGSSSDDVKRQRVDDDDNRAGPESRRREPRLPLRWLLSALLVVGFFALKEAAFWKPPLTFTVGPARLSGVLRDWEEAPDDAPLVMRFSDGTLVELEPGARARVQTLGRAGAEIGVESGRAQVSVVPTRLRLPGESAWRIDLGPFSVELTGGRLDVDWDPRSNAFALDLVEGSATVHGCERDRTRVLSAGQGLRASCSAKQWTVVPLAGVGDHLPNPG